MAARPKGGALVEGHCRRSGQVLECLRFLCCAEYTPFPHLSPTFPSHPTLHLHSLAAHPALPSPCPCYPPCTACGTCSVMPACLPVPAQPPHSFKWWKIILRSSRCGIPPVRVMVHCASCGIRLSGKRILWYYTIGLGPGTNWLCLLILGSLT